VNILVACEYSGIVRSAFAALGHNAWSCDLLPTEIPGQHYQGDVRDLLKEQWDLMIAHPPCTFLSNSGVTWLYNKDKSKNLTRWKAMQEAAEFFKMFLSVDCPMVAIENPIQHKYARAIIGEEYSQIIQPFHFGHMETKATCLWLKGLPKLYKTNDVEDEMRKLPKNKQQRLHYLPPSPDRWKERSRTFQGIASAMAAQWSRHLTMRAVDMATPSENGEALHNQISGERGSVA
jgi:hypothetical protein